MAINFFYHTLILVLYVILQFSNASQTQKSKPIGFSTYLIHRDSFESPFYNSFVNQSELVQKAIFRSSSRLAHLKSLLKLPNNATKEFLALNLPIMATRGEYLMKIYNGTPPVKQWAILDTASDVVWTQSLECINCFEQTQPKFDPRRSSSYEPILCEEPKCMQLGRDRNCSGAHNNCKYRLTYDDISLSMGELATETFKLANTYLPNMIYGCSNNNIGRFEHTTAGIIGMGNGPHSLINGLSDRIGGKFSYCLTDPSTGNTRSYISFGADAIVSSPGSISTPLFFGVPRDFYYITLDSVSVQNMRFPLIGVSKISLKGNKVGQRGNIVIDSGMTLSYLPANIYYELEQELMSRIQENPVPPPNGSLRLCYNNRRNFKIPMIMYHLSGGARLALSMKNTVIRIDGLLCLAIIPTNDNIGIIGNTLQMNYMIGYDLQNRRVSFRPNYC